MDNVNTEEEKSVWLNVGQNVINFTHLGTTNNSLYSTKFLP